MYQSEKLNWWDRLFNRYKKIVISVEKCPWKRCWVGQPDWTQHFVRTVVTYHVVDRLTGSYTIDKEYFD